MKDVKEIGVWMDHSKAKFITHQPLNEHIQTLHSEHDIMPREDGKGADGSRNGTHASNNEYHKHNKENEQLHRYYTQLSSLLEQYDNILLFGPTKAKEELKNILNENKKFAAKKICVESSDEMTNHQLLAFVREHFAGKQKA